jgi:hypothetical protein
MPLPLGHTALGLASFEISAGKDSRVSRLKIFIFVVILANLPDLDMAAGLLVSGNGDLFHRGPTHSLLFALGAGFLASKAWNLSPHIPKLTFMSAFLVVFSHILGDLIFTNAPVSLFWPLELNFSGGYSGWQDVFNSILFQGLQDFGLIIGCVFLIGLVRFVRGHAIRWGWFQPSR